MSSLTRQKVASKLIFQKESQLDDILDYNKTQTELIAALAHMQALGYFMEVTAIRTDHHLDGTSQGYHGGGWAIDLWPLNSFKDRDYMVQDTHPFRQFLKDLSKTPFLMQIGLGGCALTDADAIAAGSTEFPDDGEDHIHLGTLA